ncbi:MAG: helix-turn-helix domain-containing protein [Epulopiscium sp.]|nr:helix-turn-helix domain-containing protein [Candidatus Epulonipiscium sp.]
MTIYTTTEVAEMLKVNPATVRNEVKRGSLNCFYVGVEARFTEWHLSEYMVVKDMGKTVRELELEEEIEGLKGDIELLKDRLNNVLVVARGGVLNESRSI